MSNKTFRESLDKVVRTALRTYESALLRGFIAAILVAGWILLGLVGVAPTCRTLRGLSARETYPGRTLGETNVSL